MREGRRQAWMAKTAEGKLRAERDQRVKGEGPQGGDTRQMDLQKEGQGKYADHADDGDGDDSFSSDSQLSMGSDDSLTQFRLKVSKKMEAKKQFFRQKEERRLQKVHKQVNLLVSLSSYHG